MRLRVTTPNVLRALRKRDAGAAKPYNFALSPILMHSWPDCTLIAPTSKHPEEWLTRGYTEIHSGEMVTLGSEYRGKLLTPQTLSSVIGATTFIQKTSLFLRKGNAVMPMREGSFCDAPSKR
jgi:hypothetical protein